MGERQKYECDRCGACCGGQLIIEADCVDAEREPRLLEHTNLTLDQLQEPTEHGFFRVIMLRDPERRCCPFLDTQSGGATCQIHPTRPHTCVGFPAGGPQCQIVCLDSGHGILRDVNGNPPDVDRWPEEYAHADYSPDWLEEMKEAVAAAAKAEGQA